jgi:hypothetical protein
LGSSGRQFSEFEASLMYRVNSSIAWAVTQRNTVSKKGGGRKRGGEKEREEGREEREKMRGRKRERERERCLSNMEARPSRWSNSQHTALNEGSGIEEGTASLPSPQKLEFSWM